MIKTYKFKLEPTPEQISTIETTLWLCRRLYNAMLEQRRIAYKQHGVGLNFHSQATELPALKKELPEFKQVDAQVLQDVAKRMQRAFENFFHRVKQGEKKVGYPRFQGSNRYDSFTYPQYRNSAGGYIFNIEGLFLKLPKIGMVRIKCHRHLEGTPKTCTIKRKAGKYYACISCEVVTTVETSGRMVGVDLGVTHLAVTSDEEFFDHPKYLRKSSMRLQYLHRMVSRRKKGSNRRKKAVRLLQKQYEYIANQRKDNAHKLSRYFVRQYDLIAFEDLKITNMVKNHKLSKSIYDAGWRMLVQFTTYKAESAGKKVIRVDPYNTTQECCKCGQIVPKDLSVRIHACSCGYVAPRDVNSSHIILQRALLTLL